MSGKGKSGGDHVCPWWFAYTFDNVFRRLVHDPVALLSPYLHGGMTVLDAGCGMGHFTIGMARLVGDGGKVVAIDLQQEMLDIMMKRAAAAKAERPILPRKCTPETLGLKERFGFALAFWMVHEVPDSERFFREIFAHLDSSGRFLYAEPSFHVREGSFREHGKRAEDAGFEPLPPPQIRFSRVSLYRKA